MLDCIFGTGVRKDLIGKPVKDRRGPATVMGSSLETMSLDFFPGRLELCEEPKPGELPV